MSRVWAVCGGPGAPGYGECVELAQRLGFVRSAHNAITGQATGERRADMYCSPRLPEPERPLTPKERKEVLDAGYNPDDYDNWKPPEVVLVPSIDWFQHPAVLASTVRKMAARGIAVYVAPHTEPLNARLGLLEDMAALTHSSAELVKVAEIRARLAEELAEAKYSQKFDAMVEEFMTSWRLANATYQTVRGRSNGHAQDFGSTVKGWLAQHDKSQTWLAEQVEVDPAQISRVITRGSGSEDLKDRIAAVMARGLA